MSGGKIRERLCRFIHRKHRRRQSRDDAVQEISKSVTGGDGGRVHDRVPEQLPPLRFSQNLSNQPDEEGNTIDAAAVNADSRAPVTTTVHEREAPAVVHDTTIVNTHEVIHEQISRETHVHHMVNLIQPVVDVEVLPARHFVQSPDGRMVECAEGEVPAVKQSLGGQ